MAEEIDLSQQKQSFMVSIVGWPIKSEDIYECYFIEDIFSLSIAGRIKFKDSLSIIEKLEGMSGQGYISITYGAIKNVDSTTGLTSSSAEPSWDAEHTNQMIFYIQNITALQTDYKTHVKSYDILFCDLSYFLFNNLQFSYSYTTGSKPHEIIVHFVTQLCKLGYETGTAETIEATKNEMQCFYSPYWNFRQCATYLLPRCRSAQHDVSGYLAFSRIFSESLSQSKMQFCCMSLENMLQQDNTKTYYYNKFDFYTTKGPLKAAMKETAPKVLDFSILSYNNFSFKHLQGATYYGYDPSKGKEPFKLAFEYTKALEKTTILGKYSLFPDTKTEEKYMSSTTTDTDMTKPVIWTLETDEEVIENIFYDDWVKRYCQQQMIEIVIAGNVHRKIGQMGELYMPRQFDAEYNGYPQAVGDHFKEGPLDDPQLAELNPKWSGKALIKSITHYFVPSSQGYIQKIVLIKNGLENPKGAPFLEAKKSNTGLVYGDAKW